MPEAAHSAAAAGAGSETAAICHVPSDKMGRIVTPFGNMQRLGAASQTTLSVPATLHASLMARLDRLGPPAKEIAQIAAVLGREFAYELMEPVAQRPTTELQAALGQLT